MNSIPLLSCNKKSFCRPHDLLQNNFTSKRFQYATAYINFSLYFFFWALDAATLKKRLQIRIVGQERDNTLIVSWNDTSPGGSVSIEMILQFKWSRQQQNRRSF